MIPETLKNIGLNDKEIAVYLMLLKLGSAPASLIGKRTNIGRSMTQYICQNLFQKGLLRMVPRNNSFLYSPESPEKLLYLLARQKKEIEQREQDVHNIIGELTKMMNPQSALPKVRFFEGVTGIIEMFNDVLQERTVIYGAARFDMKIEGTIREYLKQEYTPRRISSRVPSYFLYNDNPESLDYLQIGKKVDRKSLIIPSAQFPFECGFRIYGNKVSFTSFQENDLTGVIIENEHVRQTQYSVFKMAWNFARTLKNNSKVKDLELPD